MQRPRTVEERHPPKWLKPHDLKPHAGGAAVIIERVDWEELYTPQTKKSEWLNILKFKGKSLRMILNKTQEMKIAEVLGTEVYDEWVGKALLLKAGKAPTGADTIVVFREPTSQSHPAPQQPVAEVPTEVVGDDLRNDKEYQEVDAAVPFGEPYPNNDTPPPTFDTPVDALNWGMRQGVFNAMPHAVNSYEKMKQEKTPQTARQARDFWVEKVLKKSDATQPPPVGEQQEALFPE